MKGEIRVSAFIRKHIIKDINQRYKKVNNEERRMLIYNNIRRKGTITNFGCRIEPSSDVNKSEQNKKIVKKNK